MTDVKVTDRERPVLKALANSGWSDLDPLYLNFRSLCERRGLSRAEVRLQCRSLKRKLLAGFAMGLRDDGHVAGSGYAISSLGLETWERITNDHGN